MPISKSLAIFTLTPVVLKTFQVCNRNGSGREILILGETKSFGET